MKTEKQTQKKAILNHLKTKGSITSMEAFKKYGATRLSARIFDLRDDGHIITTENQQAKTRFNTHTTYAKYIYVGGK